jgi:hypothetical protein
MEYPEKFPPDTALRGMAAIALKETKLFGYLSRRLLIDVVEWRNLTTVGHGPGAVKQEPAVLVVLERPIVVSEGRKRKEGRERKIVLQPGTYLRYEAPLRDVEWQTAFIEAVVDQPPARVFMLEGNDIDSLPPMVVNALDPRELERLRDVTD